MRMTEYLSNIHRLITQRYTLAVLLIALLSTGAFYILKSALNDAENTALVVNLAGKQRMLSQHIALDVHRIHLNIDNRLTNDYQQAISSLKAYAADMKRANQVLSTGLMDAETKLPLSAKMQDMYFGKLNLSQRVEDYTDLALSVLNMQTARESYFIVQKMDQLSEPLLRDLNKAVLQYQKEGEARLSEIETIELVVWLITLSALLLEVIFIFRPMARKVVEATENERESMKNLQNLVELRTIKLENANKKLMKLATRDPLTDLKNRLTLESDVEKLVEEYDKNNQPFALAMVDIDWFKAVNDTHGHQAGDAVLKRFAELLRDSVRVSDRVYRSGGEEFVILFNRITVDEALAKLEYIRALIQKHMFEYERVKLSLTASFGMYYAGHFPVGNVQQILKLADMALYQSKMQGRNRVSVAEPELENRHLMMEPVKTHIKFKYADLDQMLSADNEFKALTGYAAEEFKTQRMRFKSIVYALDQEVLKQVSADIRKKGLSQLTLRLMNAQGQVQVFELQAQQEQTGVEVTLQRAVNPMQVKNDELLVQNFEAMMETTNDFIYFKNRHHIFTAVSQTMTSVTRFQLRDELVGKTDYEIFPQAIADQCFELEKALFKGDMPMAQVFQTLAVLRNPNIESGTDLNVGQPLWLDNRKYPMRNKQGNIIGIYGIARVISDEEYSRLTHTDPSE